MIETEGAAGRRVARVLLDSVLPQLDHLFDYRIPDELAEQVRVGQRVRVPFRSKDRKSFGYIVGFAHASEFSGELSPIAELVSPVPMLTPAIWQLARAVADRAGGSACDIIRLGIPPRRVRVEKQHLSALADVAADSPPENGVVDSSTESESTAQDESGFNVTPEEAATADLLIDGARLSELASHGPIRLGTGEWIGGWAERLARTVLAVYAAGRSVIIIVPDYRDLDQVRDALEAHGHDHVVRVDSRQSDPERYAGFLRALDDAPRIILGNRSAIYAPAFDLGAIVMWDDGDPLCAEPLSPYVHARDAALVRAEQSGAGLLFAGHTRSLDVQRLIDLGYVTAQTHLPRRTRIVHADAAIAPEAFAGRVPEFAAREIRRGLAEGPVLVQVATPGYAPISVCASCTALARCLACHGPIGFRSAARGSCRWCGELATGWRCAACGGAELERRGMGSTRTAEQFEKQFEGTRIIVSDGDHPRGRVDGRPALVVATRGAEPVAAGGYRAVILLDADRLLGIESLRAGEDCLRWWENAAALAAHDGVCVMASGGGPVVQAFVTGRLEGWAHAELRDRHELRYPPAVRVASVTGGSEEVERALETLDGLPRVDALGPTPVISQAGPAGESPSGLRAIIRFDYAQGAEVAKRLRGALVADAAGTTPARRSGRKPGRAHPDALRLRFDDRGVFDA